MVASFGPFRDDPDDCMRAEYIELTGNAKLSSRHADMVPVLESTYPIMAGKIVLF